MVDLVYYLANLLFFDTPLFYYCINLRSSIIFCLYSGDICLTLDVYLSHSFVIVSEIVCGELLEMFVILLENLLPAKSLVAYAIF